MAKVLVIDDEADFREVIKFVLEFDGHEVVEAEDGQSGLNAFHESNPDLVITDIFMPGKDGLETIREFYSLNPNIKIIAMSGGGGTAGTWHLGMARAFGAKASINKPFRALELKALVSAQLFNTSC